MTSLHMVNLWASHKKKVLRSVRTLNSKNTWSGKWNVPGKNLVVFATSLTFPPKNPPAMEPVHNPKKYSSQKPPYKRTTYKTRQQFYSKPDQPYYKKPYKFTKPHRPFQSKSKPKFDPKNITCYKCNQKGHTSRFCKVNTKLHEL